MDEVNQEFQHIPKSHSKKIIIPVIFITILLFLVGTFFAIQHTQIDTSQWTDGKKLIDNGLLPKPEKILEVTIHYNKLQIPSISIGPLFVKNGYHSDYFPLQNAHQIEILDSNNQLLAYAPFTIPTRIHEIPPPGQPYEKIDVHALQITEYATTFTFPYNENMKKIRVYDPSGVLIRQQEITSVEYINNPIKFKSQFVKKAQGNSYMPQSYAQAKDGYLDIVFIGDGFQDMEQFRTAAERGKEGILSFQPYTQRASQIRFHLIENTRNLDCGRKFKDIPRVVTCNNDIVKQTVNSSGVPNDTILVIWNDPEVGGAAYRDSNVAVMANNSYLPLVAIHEMAHSFAGLHDEYSIGDNDVVTNTVEQNCYKGTPKAEVWPGIPVKEYSKECYHDNWYRSSPNSIMRDLNAKYFNEISKKAINERLDFYAGSLPISPSPCSSTDPVACPNISATITSTPSITPRATPTAGIPTITPRPTSITQLTPTPSLLQGTCSVSIASKDESNENFNLVRLNLSGKGGTVILQMGQKGTPGNEQNNAYSLNGLLTNYGEAFSAGDASKVNGKNGESNRLVVQDTSDSVYVNDVLTEFKVYEWDKKFKKNPSVSNTSTNASDFLTGKARGWWYFMDYCDGKTTQCTKSNIQVKIPKNKSVYFFCSVRIPTPDTLVCNGNPICSYNEGPDLGAVPNYACDAWKQSCSNADYIQFVPTIQRSRSGQGGFDIKSFFPK